MVALTGWTAEAVRELIDESRHWPRYEVIDGELCVTPAPRPVHQEAAARLWALLDAYIRPARLGHVFLSPADIEFGPRTLVQPDVFIVPLIEGRRPRAWSEVTALLLAVEIVSRGSARRDRGAKRRLYQRQRVPEYWVVDLDARLVERWRPADERPEIVSETLVWQPDAGSAPLVVVLAGMFEEVLGEE
ncbi:MAG TPA: Uma2 family endonuclease [Gemmatimonadaceae bacterium]|nr:Uma2 family endonuclease [Gemmatimonadaceae bacterium]